MDESYKDFQPDSFYWNPNLERIGAGRGRYIAVSGNTGAGKSTLVRGIWKHLGVEQQDDAAGINERVLHHPLLRLMFSRPKEYALFVQLNFLLQRHALLYHWLYSGRSVVIERSHVDDRLFVESHAVLGNISAEEVAAYDQVASVLRNKLPDPDLYIYLDAPPALSMERLRTSEEAGERPREFPDEDTKRMYVEAWYQKYSEHYIRLIDQKNAGVSFSRTRFVRYDAGTPTTQTVSEVTALLADMHQEQ